MNCAQCGLDHGLGSHLEWSKRHDTPRERFNAWLEAEFFGINLTDHQVNAMQAAFTAGAASSEKSATDAEWDSPLDRSRLFIGEPCYRCSKVISAPLSHFCDLNKRKAAPSAIDAPPVAWGPEKQAYPGGPIYRVGSSTGVGAPQPSQEAIDFEEAARDRRDAERYRWLLEKWSTSHGAHHVEWRFDIGCAEVYGLEALIDKAMEDK